MIQAHFLHRLLRIFRSSSAVKIFSHSGDPPREIDVNQPSGFITGLAKCALVEITPKIRLACNGSPHILASHDNRWAKESWCFESYSLSPCCARLLLSAGSPIGGRIRDAPKTRRGPCEFHSNLSRSRQLFLYVDHTALFLFPAVYVLHEEPLLRRYFFR